MRKSLAIFTFSMSRLRAWDPDSIDEGIGGSEEAVIYLAEELAILGFKVMVFGTVPENSRHLSDALNPRYIDLELLGEEERAASMQGWAHTPFDIAVSWRVPEWGPMLRSFAKRVYLWPHDLCTQAIDEKNIRSFDDVLWISEFQRQQWITFSPSFERFRTVFGNAIHPKQFSPIATRENPFSCIYGSAYSRGLEHLIELWPTVKREFPQATLDIYYGFQSGWGMFSASEERAMRQKIALLDGAIEHGQVGHQELARAFEKASFWTYPCNCSETFCITALRAQFAGAIPVVIQRAALQETVRHGFRCRYPDEYLELLLQALGQAQEISLQQRSEMRGFILNKYTWNVIANQWNKLFEV